MSETIDPNYISRRLVEIAEPVSISHLDILRGNFAGPGFRGELLFVATKLRECDDAEACKAYLQCDTHASSVFKIAMARTLHAHLDGRIDEQTYEKYAKAGQALGIEADLALLHEPVPQRSQRVYSC
ncbi:MAG: hypothetical protein J0L97_07435 [Alphaproteobacteria bacterium]|nr:hypothetical protein [Alphaproteobacteria bacterium]